MPLRKVMNIIIIEAADRIAKEIEFKPNYEIQLYWLTEKLRK